MFLERAEQLHGTFIRTGAYFAQRICFLADLSGSALDRESGLDLILFTPVDGRSATFLLKGMDDHLEPSIAISDQGPPQFATLGQRTRLASDKLRRLQVAFEVCQQLLAAERLWNNFRAAEHALVPQGTAQRMNSGGGRHGSPGTEQVDAPALREVLKTFAYLEPKIEKGAHRARSTVHVCQIGMMQGFTPPSTWKPFMALPTA